MLYKSRSVMVSSAEGHGAVKVSIIGIGKLGASIAAAIASCGSQVVCVDVNQNQIDMLNAGLAPVQEPSLPETISAHRANLRATSDYRDAIHNSEVTFVFVPTPSDAHGAFTIQNVAKAFEEIGRALATKNGYHLVVVGSTVLPGSTRYGLLPILERSSGKVCGEDFGLCYNPEFVALGSVIHDFLNPDMVMIGEFDTRSGAGLEEWWHHHLQTNTSIRRMSLENAELAKIAANNYLTVKITFANMLAELCQQMPGGNVDVVTNALGLDRRIGSRFLTGGLGYGGPCFPRDTAAMGFLSRLLRTPSGPIDAVADFNRGMPKRVVRQISSVLRPGARVAVLGLSYKPMTPEIVESQSIALALEVIAAGCRVCAYDPLAGGRAKNELGNLIEIAVSIPQCLEGAEFVLVTTADPAFRSLTAADFSGAANPVTVLDFWRMLDPELRGYTHINYIPYGSNLDGEANTGILARYWEASAAGRETGYSLLSSADVTTRFEGG